MHATLLRLLAVLPVTTLPLAATAADLYGRSAPPVRWDGTSRPSRPAIWEGLYIGAHLGVGIPHVGFSDYASGNVAGSALIGGVHAGYNVPLGYGLIGGMEFDASWSGMDGSDDLGGGRQGSASFGTLATARGRLGYAWGDALFYVTGGAAFANLSTSLTTGGITGTSDGWRTGWVVGGGAEMKIDPRVSVRLEALYNDFGSDRTSWSNGTSKVGVDVTTVRAGLTYHWN